MLTLGIVGFIGSGKDTLANMICSTGSCQNIVRKSFAAPLKDVCSAIFGWPREMLEGDTIKSRDFRETPDMFWSRKLGIANFTPRLALQLIGTDTLRNNFHENIWLDSLEYRLRSEQNECVIITDARFRNELALIADMRGKIIWVQRGELPEWYDIAVEANKGNVLARKKMQTTYCEVHESEWNWAGYPVDYIINNNGTMEDLQEQVNQLTGSLSTYKNHLKLV